MSKRIEDAVTELGKAIAEEAQEATIKARELGVPFITGLMAQVAGAVASIQTGIGKEAKKEAEVKEAAEQSGEGSLSMVQIKAIKALILTGQSDEEIAEALKVSTESVRMLR